MQLPNSTSHFFAFIRTLSRRFVETVSSVTQFVQMPLRDNRKYRVLRTEDSLKPSDLLEPQNSEPPIRGTWNPIPKTWTPETVEKFRHGLEVWLAEQRQARSRPTPVGVHRTGSGSTCCKSSSVALRERVRQQMPPCGMFAPRLAFSSWIERIGATPGERSGFGTDGPLAALHKFVSYWG